MPSSATTSTISSANNSSSISSSEQQPSVLFYYSKSSDKPPGKGSNETLGHNKQDYFSELAAIKNWRRVLSNFHIGPFIYDGKTYRTAEHCFQAHKIALVSKTLAHTFCMESKSKLSRGDGEDARKQRKAAILDENQLKQWNRMKHEIMQEILYCKFSQNEDAKKVLLATRDAELWHGTRGVPKSRQFDLEKVRERILKENLALSSSTSSSSDLAQQSNSVESVLPCDNEIEQNEASSTVQTSDDDTSEEKKSGSTWRRSQTQHNESTSKKKRKNEDAFDRSSSSSRTSTIEPSTKTRKRK
ncbi:hypothetical protein FDP41_012071 [Naegleria fowleri]|uniref:NADAR domain-containing protein n=1 Tax=Naegleria fowleri TaxID=5763 RepID=A0A6A5C8Y7_NAEFO|nr:uncharacterized protein FDP41_012071 [Naegleria fowleri]KAF0982210.1 hypothetical protein FDP41_012071 [Naegleria fowleri]CAG4708118.1 unnamed protein product [Naegleria fowleri]